MVLKTQDRETTHRTLSVQKLLVFTPGWILFDYSINFHTGTNRSRPRRGVFFATIHFSAAATPTHPWPYRQRLQYRIKYTNQS